MIIIDPRQYIESKGWKWKPARKPGWLILVCDCPFCGALSDREDFFIREIDGAYYCRSQQRIGSFVHLKRTLGDLRFDVREAATWREELERNGEADALSSGRRPPDGLAEQYHDGLIKGPGLTRAEVLSYLVRELGLTTATIRRFMIGCTTIRRSETFGTPASVILTVPHHYHGAVRDIRYWGQPVTMPDRLALSERACPRVLFNGDCLEYLRKAPAGQRQVFVCGNEWSAMALAQLGFEFVVGADDRHLIPGTVDPDHWPAHWTEPLLGAVAIYLCHDATESGQAMAERQSRILGPHRCIRILPPEGLTSWIEALSGDLSFEDVEAAIAKGEKMAPKEVTRTSDYLAELEAAIFVPQSRGIPTDWPELDRFWGGIRPGEMTVVTGGSGDGKSTWTTALSYQLASKGVPVLSVPLELTQPDILGMLVSMRGHKRLHDMKLPELREAARQVFELPFYMLDVRDRTGGRKTSMPVDELIEYLRYAIEAHGVKLVVLDHLIRFLPGEGEDQQIRLVRPTMVKLEAFTRSSGIHLMVVCHPKTMKSASGRRIRYSINDIWGGSATQQEAWNGISINRISSDDRASNSGDITEVRVEKCRSQAGDKGLVRFCFDPHGLRYISEGEAGAALANGMEEGGDRSNVYDLDRYRGWSDDLDDADDV